MVMGALQLCLLSDLCFSMTSVLGPFFEASFRGGFVCDDEMTLLEGFFMEVAECVVACHTGEGPDFFAFVVEEWSGAGEVGGIDFETGESTVDLAGGFDAGNDFLADVAAFLVGNGGGVESCFGRQHALGKFTAPGGLAVSDANWLRLFWGHDFDVRQGVASRDPAIESRSAKTRKGNIADGGNFVDEVKQTPIVRDIGDFRIIRNEIARETSEQGFAKLDRSFDPDGFRISCRQSDKSLEPALGVGHARWQRALRILQEKSDVLSDLAVEITHRIGSLQLEKRSKTEVENGHGSC